MPQLKVELDKVISKIASGAPDLTKGERNQFGKFNYVSIDEYYRSVASLASAEGFTWVCREDSCHSSGETRSQKGQVTPVFTFRYVFDVYYGGECYKDFTSFSIIHPFQGPQTAGSAASYAEKLFMRTVFKVVTGEGDADAVDGTMQLKVDKQKKTTPKVPDHLKPVVKQMNDSDSVEALVAVHDTVKGLDDNDQEIINGIYAARLTALASEIPELNL